MEIIDLTEEGLDIKSLEDQLSEFDLSEIDNLYLFDDKEKLFSYFEKYGEFGFYYYLSGAPDFFSYSISKEKNDVFVNYSIFKKNFKKNVLGLIVYHENLHYNMKSNNEYKDFLDDVIEELVIHKKCYDKYKNYFYEYAKGISSYSKNNIDLTKALNLIYISRLTNDLPFIQLIKSQLKGHAFDFKLKEFFYFDLDDPIWNNKKLMKDYLYRHGINNN